MSSISICLLETYVSDYFFLLQESNVVFRLKNIIWLVCRNERSACVAIYLEENTERGFS